MIQYWLYHKEFLWYLVKEEQVFSRKKKKVGGSISWETARCCAPIPTTTSYEASSITQGNNWEGKGASWELRTTRMYSTAHKLLLLYWKTWIVTQ